MKQPFYQSHDGIAGMTDTAARWDRLRIPAKLDGWRVLDIGCNEGLISHWCSERGATEVIGIDFDRDRIVFANQHYARDNVHFLHQRWNDLPAGSFDLVLWTSAMHYEVDPKNILMNIKSRLPPSGLLVLECGVIQWPGREMIPYARQNDIRFYPTKDFLEKWLLADFSIREVSPPEPLLGEPAPRAVYHCRPRVPTVVFVIGPTGTGKTNFANRYFGNNATKVINLDEVLTRVAKGAYHPVPFYGRVRDLYDPNNLLAVYRCLGEAETCDQFLDWMHSFIASTDDLVVFEGHLDPRLIALFKEKASGLRIWVLTRNSDVLQLT